MVTDEFSPEEADQRFDEALRRALSTPPISNEDIVKRSKESRGAKSQSK